MSIKDLFNSKGSPKIQKSVTTEELVDQVESSEFVEAKRKQHEQFIPPIDFTTASNFAKFGSAELYYEKAFERIGITRKLVQIAPTLPWRVGQTPAAPASPLKR